MEKLYFSGHESFYCRYFWLKKGYDFVQNKHDFNNPNAVIELGVGKNMVAAIRHWLKAFGLVDEKEQAKPLTNFLFDANRNKCEEAKFIYNQNTNYTYLCSRIEKQPIHFLNYKIPIV